MIQNPKNKMKAQINNMEAWIEKMKEIFKDLT